MLAIYVRVSGQRQEEGASLGTQEDACRRRLVELGYDLSKVVLYREVHTGIDYRERPELSRLREAIQQRTVSLVMCYDLDRLSRDPDHIAMFFHDAGFYGVDVEFAVGGYDDSPEAGILRYVKSYAGKAEYERIRDRTRRGHSGRVSKGLPTVGARVPYGLKWANKEKSLMEEDPSTSPTLRRIFTELASGSSARQVAIRLSAEGIPTPTGLAVWRSATICKMIANPIYEGRRECLRWERQHENVPGEGRKVRQRLRSDGTVIIENVAPRLVSADVVAAARAQLPRNRTYSVRNMRDPSLSLLRGGHAFCGYCGRSLGLHKSRALYYYICTQHDRYGCENFTFSATKLDGLAWEKVREVVSRPEIIREELEKQRDEDPTADDLAALDRLMTELTRKQTNLVKRLADVDDMVAGLVQKELGLITDQLRRLQSDRDNLEQQHHMWVETQDWASGLEDWCVRVADNLEQFDYDERRLALRALGLEARVWSTNHNPRLEIRIRLLDSLAPLDWRS